MSIKKIVEMISSHLLNFIMDLCFSHKRLLPSTGLCGLGTAIDYEHSIDVSKTICILQFKPAPLDQDLWRQDGLGLYCGSI